MASVKVRFEPEGKTVEAQPGETLLDVASRAGIYINSLCGGQGVCGKCRLKVKSGSVESSSKGLGFLDRKEIDAGFVLACQSKIKDQDVEVWVPPESRQEDEQILMTDNILHYDQPETSDQEPASAGISYYQPLSQKYFLNLPSPTLEDNISDLDRIFRKLRKRLPETRLQSDFSCLRGLARLLRDNNWKITATVHSTEPECFQLQSLEAGDTSGLNFGVAIDVGTTTIVAQLIDLRAGKVVGVEASHNQQAHYGEDVIARMIFACSRGGLDPLKNAVVTTINSLINSLVVGSGLAFDDITSFVAAGNTTMTHLLLGLEPCTIRIDPYIPTATRFPWVYAREIGIQGHPRSVLHCMPCVSSYVGGDITAGVLACGMNDRPELSALIDVGTNGEIVIGNNEWLVCCSASAGPAFEGGGIKCGMRATKGAVQKAWFHNGRLRYETIGGASPRGICGSGLIDLMAELLAAGVIDQAGKFATNAHPGVRVVDGISEFIVAPAAESESGEDVVITEDDIGNLIKSKGAVLAAMKVLIENLGMSFNDLQKVYVAGGFGAHLDIEKAVIIGLLPDLPKERIQFIGNSSVAGARQSLVSSFAYRKAEAIAKQMTYFELSVHPGFMNEFVAALFLPHTQMELFPTVRAFLNERAASRR